MGDISPLVNRLAFPSNALWDRKGLTEIGTATMTMSAARPKAHSRVRGRDLTDEDAIRQTKTRVDWNHVDWNHGNTRLCVCSSFTWPRFAGAAGSRRTGLGGAEAL